MTLREGKWPQLAMVLYRQQHVVHTRVDKDFRGKLHPIASVGLSCDPHANDFTHEQVAVILSPKRKQRSAQPPTQPPTQPPSYDGVPPMTAFLRQPCRTYSSRGGHSCVT